MRLKDVAYINRHVLSESTNPAYAFKYIDISSINGLGEISVPSELVSFDSAPSRARRLAPKGSSVISTVRTYLRAIAPVPECDEPLVFSTGFAILEPKSRMVDSRFLAYLCRSDSFVDEVVARSVGVSYPAINPHELGSIPLNLPDVDEQRRIADFLDVQMIGLDRLRQSFRELADVADKRARAVVDHAFSSIPKEATVPVSAVCRKIVDCVNKTAPISDEITPYKMIRTSNIRNGEIDLADASSVTRQVFTEWNRRGAPQEGDVLFTREAPLGQAGMFRVEVPAFLGQRIMLYRANEDLIAKELLLFNFLSSHVDWQLRLLGAGSLHEHMRVGDGLKLRIYCPPRAEQRDLVTRIEAGRKQSARLAETARRQLTLLTERRQALITAAVTGQIDVKTAGGLPEVDGVAV